MNSFLPQVPAFHFKKTSEVEIWMEAGLSTCLGHLHATLLKTEKVSVVPIKGWGVDGHGYLCYCCWPQGILSFWATSKPALSTTTGHKALASSTPGGSHLACRRWIQCCGRHGYSSRSLVPQNLPTLPVDWHPIMGSNEEHLLANSIVRTASLRTGTREALSGSPALPSHIVSYFPPATKL